MHAYIYMHACIYIFEIYLYIIYINGYAANINNIIYDQNKGIKSSWLECLHSVFITDSKI